MRILFAIVFLLMVAGCDTTRNTPDPEESFFLRLYGTDGNQEAIDMVLNDDGTMILLGTSFKTSNSPSQIYLVKVGEDGFVIWEKYIDSDTGAGLVAKDIEPTVNTGQYVIAAESVYSVEESNFEILVVSDAGDGADILSSGSFSYPGVSKDVPVSVTQILDNGVESGFIITGSTNYDNGSEPGFQSKTAVFARFDQSCTIYSDAWVDNVGGEGDDFGIKVIQRAELTDAEPFVFFGYKNSPPIDNISNKTFNFWCSKTSRFGGDGIVSNVLKGSPDDMDEVLGSVSTINSGSLANYILTGIISPIASGQERIYISVVKDAALFGDGTLAPQVLPYDLGDLSLFDPKFKTTSSTGLRDGGYLVASNTAVSGNADIMIVKLNSNGSTRWTEPVMIGGQGDDWQAMVHELPDRKILLLGTMQVGDDRQSKMALCKMNPNGKFE